MRSVISTNQDGLMSSACKESGLVSFRQFQKAKTTYGIRRVEVESRYSAGAPGIGPFF
jgi:hypothetical protein